MSKGLIWLSSNSTNSGLKVYVIAVLCYVSGGDFANISEILLEELVKTSELGIRGPKICRVWSGSGFLLNGCFSSSLCLLSSEK